MATGKSVLLLDDTSLARPSTNYISGFSNPNLYGHFPSPYLSPLSAVSPAAPTAPMDSSASLITFRAAVGDAAPRSADKLAPRSFQYVPQPFRRAVAAVDSVSPIVTLGDDNLLSTEPEDTDSDSMPQPGRAGRRKNVILSDEEESCSPHKPPSGSESSSDGQSGGWLSTRRPPSTRDDSLRRRARKRRAVVADDEGERPVGRSLAAQQATLRARKPAMALSDDDGDVIALDDDDDDSPPPVISFEPEQFKRPSKRELREQCLSFFNNASVAQLSSQIVKCNEKMAETVCALRPFASYDALESTLYNTKGVLSTLSEGFVDQLSDRSVLDSVLSACNIYSYRIKQALESRSFIRKTQPDLIQPGYQLAPYQLVGLNWLIMMNEQRLNSVLADEMGLGKTIQIIAFLAHLKEKGSLGVALIVVPSSTIGLCRVDWRRDALSVSDNWMQECAKWCGERLCAVAYYGSQDDRKYLRTFIQQQKAAVVQRALVGDGARQVQVDVVLTTYNMVTSSKEDSNFFRSFRLRYVIFDEAHMLKNCATKRFKQLLKIRADRKIMLTGTPLQNNLVELMSLLFFVMPDMFRSHLVDKDQSIDVLLGQFAARQGALGHYENETVAEAKKIIAPFVLRRLKADVLQQLPRKSERVVRCQLAQPEQAQLYAELKERLRAETSAGVRRQRNAVMQLRHAANHALLQRTHFDDERLREMSRLLVQYPKHADAKAELIFEDLEVFNDFELDRLCADYPFLESFRLPADAILRSGKIKALDELLPSFKANNEKVIMFSQFKLVLDILEPYLTLRGLRYLRLDGSTPVVERSVGGGGGRSSGGAPFRQQLIDDFNGKAELDVFLLSTRAGGLGINLTAASVIVLHDIDYNPHNDRQAEDRCHRIGQTRPVTVVRLIAADTVDEHMLACARGKLALEQRVTGAPRPSPRAARPPAAVSADDDDDANLPFQVESVLKAALGD